MDHIKQLEMMKVNGFDMGLDNEDYEALDAAIEALRAVREAPVVRVAPGAVKDSGWIMYADDGDGMPVELPFKSDSAVYLVPVGEGEA